MRRVIIDTDTGTDDAAAIVMALRDKNVKVEAITTVAGNVNVDRATINALMSVEMADTYAPPVYKGISRPILKEPVPNKKFDAHGEDGMGDLGLPLPKLKEEDEHAVDFLIRYIEENPNELEIFAIGPVTNLAWICHRSPDTLKKVKKIYMMMGTGMWFGNASPLAEGNALMDPEALDIVFRYAGTELILIGWDLCIHEYMFGKKEMDYLYSTGSKVAKFCLDINHTLVSLNSRRFGEAAIDWADPVAMAVALEPDMVEESVTAYHRCETQKGLSYGCISIDWSGRSGHPANATTCTKLNVEKMKKCVMDRLI